MTTRKSCLPSRLALTSCLRLDSRWGAFRKRVVLVEMGRVRHFSDIVGRHTVHLSNSVASRHEFAIRLQTAGCAVDLSGTDWHTAGDLSAPPPLLSFR